MRPVKHPPLAKQPYTYACPLPLAFLRPQLDKEPFDVTPLDIGADRSSEEQFQRFPVFFFTHEQYCFLVPLSSKTATLPRRFLVLLFGFGDLCDVRQFAVGSHQKDDG